MNSVRVVLVRTEVAANLGSVARIMCNFGLHDLVLVSPVADPLSEPARQLATHHAFHLLQQARLVADLETALADCVSAAATSARTGGLFRRQTVGPPEQIAQLFPPGRVALVFGPEPSGLTNDEILRCPHLIHIPTNETCPALNLAQSVAICLYELQRVRLERERCPASPVASLDEQHRMFAKLEESLRQVRYLRGVRGEALMHALRHLLSRAQPSPMEVRLLLGLARQLRWVAERTRFEEE